MSLLVVAGCIAPGGWSASDRATTESIANPPTTDSTATEPGSPITDGGEEPAPTIESERRDAKQSRPAGLESGLYDLVTAENRTTHAEIWNLAYRNGRVEVVVELQDGRQLPGEFDVSVQSRHEHLVQATIPVEELVALSEHENVSFVRRPYRADVHQPSPTSPTDDS